MIIYPQHNFRSQKNARLCSESGWGALSIYIGGDIPRHIQKRGPRHGHNQKRGVLGTGTSGKEGGVLGTDTSGKRGVLGTGTKEGSKELVFSKRQS